MTEELFCSLIEQLAGDVSRRGELFDLLREDHSIYDQRGAAVVVQMRGWVLLALARDGLSDAALPFVLEELDAGVDAYLVACAAFALRAYAAPNSAFAPFVVRAVTNIRYRDERVSLEKFGGFAIGPGGTSPVRELLATLTWLGPNARAVVSEIESFRSGPTALSKKYQPAVGEVLAAVRGDADVASDCCSLPSGVQDLFSWMKKSRTAASAVESTVLEDQAGQSITFGEFFHGQPSIVAFFYTRCDNPLKCSLTITKLARVQKLLESNGLAERINTAGISYDPEFDSPQRLLKYGEDRGVRFAPGHRLLRAGEDFDSLRRHFKLGVNFIESLVNRHRIELYILDAQGRVAGYFGRVQWDENDIVQRAIEVLDEETEVVEKRRRASFASPAFATAAAVGLALFPKCPLCWAAYLSLFGIAGLESIPYSPWLQPVLAILLLLNMTSVWFRGRSTGRMMPFYFVAAGALALIASKAFNLPLAAICGILLTVSGSLWATLSTSRLDIGGTSGESPTA
ncbi:MAG TPA: SCO family protein [Pyrinomonadaceae bacterium]|nr:SCO family protein [Pyrinomonadaceae bacterium]